MIVVLGALLLLLRGSLLGGDKKEDGHGLSIGSITSSDSDKMKIVDGDWVGVYAEVNGNVYDEDSADITLTLSRNGSGTLSTVIDGRSTSVPFTFAFDEVDSDGDYFYEVFDAGEDAGFYYMTEDDDIIFFFGENNGILLVHDD